MYGGAYGAFALGDSDATPESGAINLAAAATISADASADLLSIKPIGAAGAASANATADLLNTNNLGAAGSATADAVAQFAGGPVPLTASANAMSQASAAASGQVTQALSMRWRPVVTIGGVDISARLIGSISVQQREDSARVCDFSILPTSGTLLPQQWIGKAVTVDFADSVGGLATNPRRLFTGVIDVPSIDGDTSVMRLTCTDDFQGKVSAMPRAQIDATVGGLWSNVVSDEDADNWIYLQDRMASVRASCELDVLGGLRVVSWQPKGAPDFSFGNSSLISTEFYFAGRSEIINRVAVSFDYQFPRLKKRAVSCGYSYPFSLDQIMMEGYSIPSRAMIADAISGTGWEVNGQINFTPCPSAPQPPINLGGGVFGAWAVTPDVAIDLCFGFVAGLRKRFAQQATDRWSIDVKCDASIAALGEIRTQISGSLRSSFDATEWESYRASKVVDGVWEASGPSEPEPIVPDPIGDGETYIEPTTGVGDDKDDALAAVDVLVARAKKMIAGSHRGSGVILRTPIQPLMSCAATVRVDCRSGLAHGKVKSVTHELDLASGQCITTADVAISSLMGTGYPHQETAFTAPLSAPSPPSSNQAQPSATSTHVGSSYSTAPINDTMFGYFTNVQSGSANYSAEAPVYPVQFVLRAPEIDAPSRDADAVEIVSSSDVAIGEDEFEVRVP